MRILLIAYEFPPGPSPQSLRWARLARELVRHGAQVRVLTVQRDGERVRLPVPSGLVVDRTPPGAASALIAHLRSRHETQLTAPPASEARSTPAEEPRPDAPIRLNWKGHLVECANRAVGLFTFPDTFGQWEVGARPRLRQLLREYAPDLVVSSHEPATTLRLGHLAWRLGFRWMADMGDPVLADYTRRRWRRRSRRIEALVCNCADHVTVTNEATRQLLLARHGTAADRITVVSQGYDPVAAEQGADAQPPPLPFDPQLLELVYTGSFYPFRSPRALVDAIVEGEGVRLTVASRSPPDWLVSIAQTHPAKLRMAGFLTHGQALALQRGADVLVDIGNADMVQVPGKLFEYIGSGRPILHIGGASESLGTLSARRRLLAVPNERESVVAALRQLQRMKQGAAWGEHFDLRPGLFPEYEWTGIGKQLFDLVADLLGTGRGR